VVSIVPGKVTVGRASHQLCIRDQVVYPTMGSMALEGDAQLPMLRAVSMASFPSHYPSEYPSVYLNIA